MIADDTSWNHLTKQPSRQKVTQPAIERVRIFKKVSEYDQEIPQSQTADNPMAPRGRAAQPSQDTRKTS